MGGEVELFYAALELRFMFERLLIKHGVASKDFSEGFERLHWQPKQLRNHLIQEVDSRLDLEKSYKFTVDPVKEVPVVGYFLAIPEDPFSSNRRLNDFLHAR